MWKAREKLNSIEIPVITHQKKKYCQENSDTSQLVMSYLRVRRLFALVKIDFKLKFNE